MWKLLYQAAARCSQWFRKVPAEQRAATNRARFWAQVREGEREAEVRSRP